MSAKAKRDAIRSEMARQYKEAKLRGHQAVMAWLNNAVAVHSEWITRDELLNLCSAIDQQQADEREQLRDEVSTYIADKGIADDAEPQKSEPKGQQNRRTKTTTKSEDESPVFLITPELAAKLQQYASIGQWCAYAIAAAQIGQAIDHHAIAQIRTELVTIYQLRYGAAPFFVQFEDLETSNNGLSQDADAVALRQLIRDVDNTLGPLSPAVQPFTEEERVRLADSIRSNLQQRLQAAGWTFEDLERALGNRQ